MQLLILGLMTVPERRGLPALHGCKGMALGLQAVLQVGNLLVGLIGPLRGACLPVERVRHALAGGFPEYGLQACRRCIRRLRLRQPGADSGHALAFPFGQVANLGGKGEVLLHLQRGPFLGVALVLVVAGGALPCGAGGALLRALGIGAGDALMFVAFWPAPRSLKLRCST